MALSTTVRKAYTTQYYYYVVSSPCPPVDSSALKPTVNHYQEISIHINMG